MMQKLADEERQLLRHYGERERVISGLQRTFAHQYLFSGPWLYQGTVGQYSGVVGRRDGSGSKGLVLPTLIAAGGQQVRLSPHWCPFRPALSLVGSFAAKRWPGSSSK